MAEADASVSVTVILTEQELLRFTWTSLLRNKGVKGLMYLGIVMSVLFALGLCVALLSGQQDLLLSTVPCAIALPLTMFVLVPLAIRRGVRRTYRSNPNVQRETTYQFTPQSIVSSNAVSRSEVKWEALVEVLETKKDFLFFLSKQSAYAIPKTAIPSPDDRRRLRRLVLDNAGDRAKLQALDSPED
jgi:hypothetical protein